MQRRAPVWAALSLVLALGVAGAAATAAYSLTPIVGSGNVDATPWALSANGNTAGFLGDSPPFKAFLRVGSNSPVTLPTLADPQDNAGTTAQGWGVNDNGLVVGTSQLGPSVGVHAFSYLSGVLTDLNTTALGTTYGQAFACNNAGDIVGISGNVNPNFDEAFVLYPNNPAVDLGPGAAHGISANGTVVGETRDDQQHLLPFIFKDANNDHQRQDSEYVILGALVSGQEAYAFAVNDGGVAVGLAKDANGVAHAVRWTAPHTAGQAPQDLGSLAQGNSYATSINTAGDIVGTSSGLAFLWKAGSMKQLDTQIPKAAGGGPAVAQLLTGLAINDSGKITAVGIPLNTFTFTGYLLTPNGGGGGGGGGGGQQQQVKLVKVSVTPAKVFLNGPQDSIPVTTTLTLSDKPKTGIQVLVSILFNGELQLAFPMNITKKEGSSQLNITDDFQSGSYTFQVTYNNKTVSDTLVVDRLALTGLSSNKAKVKAGTKFTGTIDFNGAPSTPITVPLNIYLNNKLFLGPFNVQVKKATGTSDIKVPKITPPGVYEVRATYGEVTKSVNITVQAP